MVGEKYQLRLILGLFSNGTMSFLGGRAIVSNARERVVIANTCPQQLRKLGVWRRPRGRSRRLELITSDAFELSMISSNS